MSAKATKHLAAGMSTMMFLILPSQAWAANTPPVAKNQGAWVVAGKARTFPALYSDPDAAQAMNLSVVSSPAHGTATTVGGYFIFTSADGYTGTDSFTWKANDGVADSNVATCNIRVRSSPTDNAGTTVILVVNATLLPEIQTEVNRLKSDLTNEGHSVKITPWSSGSNVDLWTYLGLEYQTAGQILDGAILIGNIPFAANSETGETTDYVYMNLVAYGNTTQRQIWVSRMWALDAAGAQLPFGGEVTLLKRTLLANHEYRTGISRLPHAAYVYDTFGYNFSANALEIWPTVEVLDPATAMLKGGELIDNDSHGSSNSYGNVNTYSVHDLLVQVRFIMAGACSSGYPGGVANNQIFTRGGGNVMTCGETNLDYVGQNTIVWPYAGSAIYRQELAARESWGNAFMSNDPFDRWRAIFYGDMSLRVMPAPPNQMPVVNTLTANVASGPAPLTVNFSAAASDPDGSIASFEWFPEGHDFGTVSPSAAGPAPSSSHTYALPHRFLARVEAVDNYKARAYREVEIAVAPQPGQPVRVNCRGKSDYTDSQGHLWLYDQSYGSGTWGGVNNINSYVGQFDDYGNVGGATGTQADRNMLYQSVAADYYRDGSGFTYYIPVLNGGYTVNLGFADMMNTAAGQRLTDVFLNGVQVLNAFDAVAEFGSKTAGLKSFHVNVTGGMLSMNIRTNPGSPGGAGTQSSMGFLNCFEILPKTAKTHFDGDGKADILFRHPSSGQVILWLMN